MECHFHLEVFAPKGLSGIEPHLGGCTMGLGSRRSGFNGQVILTPSKLAEVEFAMDPSTEEIMHGSGCIELPLDEAWAHLVSLSAALTAADFPHRIGMDDPDGQNTRWLVHSMPR
jgi:hypothetical protein